MYHCVYCIHEKSSDMKYIGSHSSFIVPQNDIGIYYFSSSTNISFMKSQKDNPNDYGYEILSIHDSYADALKEESRLHHLYSVDVSPLYYNKVKANPYFDVHNMIAVIRSDDVSRTIIWMNRNDEGVINGTYVGCNYGTVTVKNILTGVCEKIYKEDYDPSIHQYTMSGKIVGFDESGDIKVSDIHNHKLISIHKGSVNIKGKDGYRRVDKQTRIDQNLKCVLDENVILRNKHTGIVEMISKDIDLSDYEGVNKNKVTVRDTHGNISVVYKDDPQYLSGDLVHITAGMMNVKDIHGNVYKVAVDDHRIVSGELVPYMCGFIWINDGRVNMSVLRDSVIPEGWVRGMKPGGNRKGSTGKIWINNGLENRMIPKTHDIESGWFKGRCKK